MTKRGARIEKTYIIMKIKYFLYLLLFVVFAISCTTDGDPLTEGNGPNQGGGLRNPHSQLSPLTSNLMETM